MNRKVLTTAKSTPGSVSRDDFSLVKGNTKRKVLVSAEAPAAQGLALCRLQPLRAALAAFALSAETGPTRGPLWKQAHQGHLMCTRGSHHIRDPVCIHTTQ